MNILIIGGSGHVSGAISRRAVANGDNVYIVTRGERIVPAGVTAFIADILGVELQLKELPVTAYLITPPEKAPFMCHRIYDLQAAKTAQLTLPSTSIETGLKLHVKGLLKL